MNFDLHEKLIHAAVTIEARRDRTAFLLSGTTAETTAREIVIGDLRLILQQELPDSKTARALMDFRRGIFYNLRRVGERRAA